MPPALVFSPSPVLTVTIEDRAGEADIHLHAGGQGFWVARMMSLLGLPTLLCTTCGGETGRVARTLIEHEGVDLRLVEAQEPTAAYVHDRRSGDRRPVAEMPAYALSRHELDELYNVALVEGLEAPVAVLTGPPTPSRDVMPPDTYRRLASDWAGNGGTVVADLSGDELEAARTAGLAVLKVSEDDLVRDGYIAESADGEIVGLAEKFCSDGVETMVVSRAGRPALALMEGGVVEIVAPHVEVQDERGAGDSMTAGIAAGLARGMSITNALQLGAAAGALNVTRHGLGTGRRDEIERLAAHVTVRPWKE